MKKKFLGVLLCMTVSAAMLAGCGVNRDKETNSDKISGDKDTSDDENVSDHTDVSDVTSAEEDNPDEPSGETKKIALAMPSSSIQRWSDDAANMKKELEAKGYSVDIQFAEDDAKKQASQIEEFIAAQADCIVIAAVEPDGLTQAAEAAKNAGIPVIAYDRLLMDTDAVYYYASFDHKGAGIVIGKTIAEKAGLDDLKEGEYKTIEFFMGPPDDNNARLVYNGLMEVLQPYLDDGRLVCKTERTSFDDTCIQDGSEEKAQSRCENYLAGYYMDEELDICAAAYDRLAYGCKAALQTSGYTVENWPVISGQDCEIQACKNIQEGTQTFSVYKDTRILAQKCAEMIESVLAGTEPEINDTEQYDNNKLIVPAYLCTPSAVDQDNLQEILIDGGCYTADQIDVSE